MEKFAALCGYFPRQKNTCLAKKAILMADIGWVRSFVALGGEDGRGECMKSFV